MDKKKLIGAVVAALVVLFGATITKCPWAKKQLDETVAPVFSGLF